MINVMRTIFGNYVDVVDINGNIYPNYEYIFAVIMFALAFYWGLKFIFSLFK